MARRVIITPHEDLDQFHSPVHHMTGGTIGQSQGLLVLGRMVGMPMMKGSTHLTGQGVQDVSVTVHLGLFLDLMSLADAAMLHMKFQLESRQ
uniref:Uncharacterized protein MANES_03G189500 n=1 Tax=Rhizophora mucronata TaxID=61149 RepID=A0A2P2L842_RHIMU